jgi:hypothetical protein
MRRSAQRDARRLAALQQKKGTAPKRRPRASVGRIFEEDRVDDRVVLFGRQVEFVDDGERLVCASDDVHVAFPGDGFGFGMINRAIV